MSPLDLSFRFKLPLWGAVLVILLLALLFSPVMKFVEMAARELVYFWWLVLLLLLAVWLIWGLGGKKK